MKIIWVLIIAIVFHGVIYADEIDVERLASAIRIAEGNRNYGILKKIKGTNYRKACIQTIEHARRDWNGKGAFISFLGTRYCPIGSDTDDGTCANWIPNVRRIYNDLR